MPGIPQAGIRTSIQPGEALGRPSPASAPDRSGIGQGGRDSVEERFNLFRRRPDLICAVHESRAVPPFISAEGWAWCGRVVPGSTPPGFDAGAAAVGVRFTGFHLFQPVTSG